MNLKQMVVHTRFEEAHYMIKEKKLRPSEVYFETGYENLAHFSTAFKKQFGYPPTRLE